mgnify:CR=1 FL=1
MDAESLMFWMLDTPYEEPEEGDDLHDAKIFYYLIQNWYSYLSIFLFLSFCEKIPLSLYIYIERDNINWLNISVIFSLSLSQLLSAPRTSLLNNASLTLWHMYLCIFSFFHIKAPPPPKEEEKKPEEEVAEEASEEAAKKPTVRRIPIRMRELFAEMQLLDTSGETSLHYTFSFIS